MSKSSTDFPIFIISAQADIPLAVDAIRHGALDFIEKPFDANAVVLRVREAIEAWVRRMEDGSGDLLPDQFPGRDALTPREREVLGFVIQGIYNKNIADRIGLSIKTVELYRARGMAKMQARSVAELTRMMVTHQA